MRKYQYIWEQLKKTGNARVVAKPAAHTMIIRGVRKEKNKDIAFKYWSEEQGANYRLRCIPEGFELHFSLVLTIETSI